MRIRWLPEAWTDIERLFGFLVDEDPIAAQRAVALIDEGADRPLNMPEVGVPMNDGTYRRELFLPFGAGAYVLRYRLDGDIIAIIRVWHGQEKRP